jgi:hypothetical protein
VIKAPAHNGYPQCCPVYLYPELRAACVTSALTLSQGCRRSCCRMRCGRPSSWHQSSLLTLALAGRATAVGGFVAVGRTVRRLVRYGIADTVLGCVSRPYRARPGVLVVSVTCRLLSRGKSAR